MQHSIIESTTKENMFKRGQTDVHTGAELNEQNSTIIIQAKKLVNDYIAGCKGKLNSLKKQLEDLLLRQKEVKENITAKDQIIAEYRNIDAIKTLIFGVTGCIYIMAEYYQAKQLLSTLWGLSHGLEIFTLACSVGLLPVFLKAVFDRYLHREDLSATIKRRIDIGATICCIPVLLVGLLVAYLRAKVFEYGVIDINDPNIYNPLFSEYGFIMVWSFVGLALMYAICGGYLLSISIRDRLLLFRCWGAKISKSRLFSKLEKSHQKEKDLNREIMKLEAYQYDESKYETFLHSVSEELKYAYIEGYHSEQKKIQNVEQNTRLEIEKRDLRIKDLELIQKTKSNETVKLVSKNDEMETLTNNFDVYVRSLLIKKANKLNNGDYTNE